MSVPVAPPATAAAPVAAATGVPVAQQVCVPGLPPGAASLALVQTKIGPVYVPLNAEGAPMLEHLTPQQSQAVKAALGDFFARVSMGGICGLILCAIFCPPCLIYFLIVSCCCVGYQMATFKKKLANQQVPVQSNVAAWQQQQAAAVVPGGQVPGAAPAGYPAVAVTTAPVPPTASQV